MTSGHLGLRIKRSCLRIYGVVSKEFSSRFSRSCITPSKRDRLFSAAENLCAAISKPHQESFLLQAAKNLFQGSQDSLRGATNLFRESQNSLRGANDLFRESKNSLRGAYNLFRESKNSLRGAGNLFRESQNSLRGTNCKLFWEAYKPNNESKINRLTDACVNALETALRDSECNGIIYTDCKTYLNRVDSCEPKIPQCVKNHRHS